MERYYLVYDFFGAERKMGFPTKADLNRKIKELKTNHLVKGYVAYELVETDRWSR